MKLKATDYPQIDDGVYPAFLLGIEQPNLGKGVPQASHICGGASV